MFTDEFLERIFSNEEIQKMPISFQSTAITAFEQILQEMRGENPYAVISELLSNTDAYLSK